MYQAGNGITFDIFIRNSQIRIQCFRHFFNLDPVKCRIKNLMGKDMLHLGHIDGDIHPTGAVKQFPVRFRLLQSGKIHRFRRLDQWEFIKPFPDIFFAPAAKARFAPYI